MHRHDDRRVQLRGSFAPHPINSLPEPPSVPFLHIAQACTSSSPVFFVAAHRITAFKHRLLTCSHEHTQTHTHTHTHTHTILTLRFHFFHFPTMQWKGDKVAWTVATQGVGGSPAVNLKLKSSGGLSKARVNLGETFRLTATGGKLDAWTNILLDGQFGKEDINMHTSCSVRVMVGDRYGSLTIIGLASTEGSPQHRAGHTAKGASSPGIVCGGASYTPACPKPVLSSPAKDRTIVTKTGAWAEFRPPMLYWLNEQGGMCAEGCTTWTKTPDATGSLNYYTPPGQ
jgi:hypothetical protein